MHEFRVKDVTKTGLIDDDSLWLFGCGGFLFNGRSLFLDLRGFPSAGCSLITSSSLLGNNKVIPVRIIARRGAPAIRAALTTINMTNSLNQTSVTANSFNSKIDE